MHTNNRKHLVIAPHHDDEMIGCGGTIAKAIKRGIRRELLSSQRANFPESMAALNKIFKYVKTNAKELAQSSAHKIFIF